MATEKTSLKQCIKELSSKNTDYKYPEQAINQAESLKSLSNDLYTDNIRFIYELIQNADDAQANNVTLAILDERYLIIAHDGNKCCLFYHYIFTTL
jgi:DNA-binding MurR/RpiR family transcriptional regulator